MDVKRTILGVRFDDVTMDEALARCEALIRSKTAGYVVTPNAEMVYAAFRDDSLRELLNAAALVVPDGVGVLYASRILGTPVKARVPGVELGEQLIARCAAGGYRLFLLGAKPGVADIAAEKLKAKYPGLIVAGTHDGYFKDDAPMLDLLRDAKPDVVLVCTGFPRQERFMRKAAAALPPALFLGLGGSLDIYSESLKRAPAFYCKFGLEWLYRLFQEPRRIGRMARLPLFLGLAVKEKFRRKSK